jgi:hypothetical protein
MILELYHAIAIIKRDKEGSLKGAPEKEKNFKASGSIDEIELADQGHIQDII